MAIQPILVLQSATPPSLRQRGRSDLHVPRQGSENSVEASQATKGTAPTDSGWFTKNLETILNMFP